MPFPYNYCRHYLLFITARRPDQRPDRFTYEVPTTAVNRGYGKDGRTVAKHLFAVKRFCMEDGDDGEEIACIPKKLITLHNIIEDRHNTAETHIISKSTLSSSTLVCSMHHQVYSSASLPHRIQAACPLFACTVTCSCNNLMNRTYIQQCRSVISSPVPRWPGA